MSWLRTAGSPRSRARRAACSKVASSSNHVIFLHQGRIEEQGDPKQVLTQPRSERLQQFLSGNLK